MELKLVVGRTMRGFLDGQEKPLMFELGRSESKMVPLDDYM